MRRSASEIIRNLEARIARLEKSSTHKPTIQDIVNVLNGANSHAGRLSVYFSDRRSKDYYLEVHPTNPRSDEYLDGWDREHFYEDYQEPLMESIVEILKKAFPRLKAGWDYNGNDITIQIYGKGYVGLYVKGRVNIDGGLKS